MNGPSNSERDVLDTALVWLERGLILAGGMVVVGLLMESGPEMAIALQKHHFPNRGVLGGALVTMGVFAEVVLGILITQKSHRVQDLADASIAKANERAVQAAKETAEANLARVKLEAKLVRRTTSRLLSAEEEEILTKSLSVHAGERFALVLSNLDPEGLMPINRTAERIFFAGQLQKILSAAGWIDDGTLGLPDPNVSEGVTLFIKIDVLGYFATTQASGDLNLALSKLSISCQITGHVWDTPTPLIIAVGLL